LNSSNSLRSKILQQLANKVTFGLTRGCTCATKADVGKLVNPAWSHRKLYVDGDVVAEDEQSGLAGSYNGLYIGCGKYRESGSLFSGLIDDVRIYNRVVSPDTISERKKRPILLESWQLERVASPSFFSKVH